MGTLALDIETASPFEEPPQGENSTEFFEWLSIAVAYADDSSDDPEVEVFFRRGGWDKEYTADLLDRFVDWCKNREIDRTLTYNGAWFDLRHMANWAESLEESGERQAAYTDLTTAVPNHIDLAQAAAKIHEDELRDDQEVLPDFLVYQLEGIENDSIWYEDYDFNQDYWRNLGISEDWVKGEHVGKVLGEQYVNGVIAGLEGTRTHDQLERLLYDYGASDVADLHAMYDSLGGKSLDDEFQYPMETIDR